jgi:hypothetical protein
LRRDLGQCCELRRADLRFVEPLLANGRFLGRIGIGGDVANSQVIIPQNLRAAVLLGQVVRRRGAPADDRLFVAPRRMRKNPAWSPLALETLVVHEAVDFFQERLQALGESKIFVEPLSFWTHFKDD